MIEPISEMLDQAWRQGYGIHVGFRRTLERGRAAVAQVTASAAGWSTAGVGSGVFDRYRICLTNGHALAVHSPGARVRKRRYVLASTARLDAGRRVEAGQDPAVADAACRRAHRWSAGHHGQPVGARGFGG